MRELTAAKQGENVTIDDQKQVTTHRKAGHGRVVRCNVQNPVEQDTVSIQ